MAKDRPKCPATGSCPLYPSFCIKCTPAVRKEKIKELQKPT
jgi:hypothetical protein